MGRYTEIFVNVDLKKETPEEVINTLKAMCDDYYYNDFLDDKPDRWGIMFYNGSCYTPNTSVCALTFDKISNYYSFIGKGDIKNYGMEIQDFFDYISPWAEDDFIGYYRHEDNIEPTLVYKEVS